MKGRWVQGRFDGMMGRGFEDTLEDVVRRLLLALGTGTLLLTGCGTSTPTTQNSAVPAASAAASANPGTFQPSTEAEKREMMQVGLALAYDEGIHYRCNPANAGAKRSQDIAPNPSRVAIVTFDGTDVVVTGDSSLVTQKAVARRNTDGGVQSWGFGVELKSPAFKLFGVYVHEVLPGTDRWLPHPMPVGEAGQNGQYSFRPEQVKVWPEWAVLATSTGNPCSAPSMSLPFKWRDMAKPGYNVPYPYQHN